MRKIRAGNITMNCDQQGLDCTRDSLAPCQHFDRSSG
jgi:hypothetical protein